MRLKIQRSRKEDDLVKGCKKNDTLSQRAVYDGYSAKMLGICFRYIKDSSEAEGVMIGGFTKVFNKIDQFKSEIDNAGIIQARNTKPTAHPGNASLMIS